MKYFTPFQPLLFPLAEALFFLCGLELIDSTPLLSVGAFFLAGCALNFSIHISFHEWVHHGQRSNTTISDCITILAGLPLTGYRLHHYNHHEYENGPGDLSSTWDFATIPPSPRTLLRYSLLWPVQMYNARRELRSLLSEDGKYAALRASLNHEKFVLALWYTLLFAFGGWQWVLAYISVTYLGWALASVHNYGQHMPTVSNPHSTTSYVSTLYNRVFCNNGLHHEHHAKPGVVWHELTADHQARRVLYPHPLAPLIGGAEIQEQRRRRSTATSGGIHAYDKQR